MHVCTGCSKRLFVRCVFNDLLFTAVELLLEFGNRLDVGGILFESLELYQLIATAVTVKMPVV